MRIYFASIALLLAAIAGCGEPEGSTQYYDSHIYARFIAKLDEHGIKYRKGSKLDVFYPVSQTQLVKAIASEVEAEYYPGCGGSFTTKEKQEAMEAVLRKRGIPYTVVELDQGPSITCAPEDKEAFHEAFMYVLRGGSDD